MEEEYFYVVDTETTGLSADRHAVIEVAVMRMRILGETKRAFPWKLLNKVLRVESLDAHYESFHSVDDAAEIDEDALCVSGTTRKALQERKEKGLPAYDPALLVESLWKNNPSPLLVAHNAAFDRSFLRLDALLPDARWICTKMCALQEDPNRNSSLHVLAASYFEDTRIPVHSATNDAFACARWFGDYLIRTRQAVKDVIAWQEGKQLVKEGQTWRIVSQEAQSLT